MTTQVSRPMFVNYFFLFAPWCNSVIVDDGWLSTVGNDGSECSVGENTVLSETGDGLRQSLLMFLRWILDFPVIKV